MLWLFLQLLSRIRKWNERKEGIKAREAYWMHKSLSGWRVCCFIVNGSVPLLRKSQYTWPETVLKSWSPKWRKRQKTLFCCFLFSSLPFLFNRSHTQLYNKQYFGYCFPSCFSIFWGTCTLFNQLVGLWHDLQMLSQVPKRSRRTRWSWCCCFKTGNHIIFHI